MPKLTGKSSVLSSFVTTHDESPSSSQPRRAAIRPDDACMLRPPPPACSSQSSLPKTLRSASAHSPCCCMMQAHGSLPRLCCRRIGAAPCVRTHGCLQSRSSLARQTSLRTFANSGSQHSSTRRLSTSAQCSRLCPSLHCHAMPQRIPSLCHAVRRGVPPPMRSARPRREDRLSGSERLCERAKVSAMSCRATLEGLN